MGTVIKRWMYGFVFSFIPIYSDYCYIVPPKEWHSIDPSKISSKAEAVFIGRALKLVPPTLNLMIENVEGFSLDAYICKVKKIYQEDPSIEWNDLGVFRSRFGEGRLASLDITSTNQRLSMLQLIVLRNQKSYIVTASALKEDFGMYIDDFKAILSSLTFVDDLLDLPLDQRKKLTQEIEQLRATFNRTVVELGQTKEAVFHSKNFIKNFWDPFESKIKSDFADKGSHWQLLILKEVRNGLFEGNMS